MRRIIGLIVGAIEAVLLIRLILKLLGVSPGNAIVNGIYAITQPIVIIFEGIFAQVAITSFNAAGVFETATLIAMVAVAVIGWILKMIFTPRH